MGKPLELVIYPPLEVRERFAVKAKRLTDAELAAETWQVAAEINERMSLSRRGGKVYLANVAMTFMRFATLPHHDEATP